MRYPRDSQQRPRATPLPTLDDYSRAIDAMLDAKAQALFEWRSAVWTYATEQLALVHAGEREQPSVETFIAEVETACPFAWPPGD